MFCQKCGAEIDNDSKFCPKCGAAISEDQAIPNNQTVSNSQPVTASVPRPQINASQKMEGIETKIKSVGFILGLIFIVVGIFGILNVLLSHHGTYRGDWDNEVIGILWGIRLALSVLITALGVLIDVLVPKKAS